MGAEIDNLQIKIEASARKAKTNVDSLISRLNVLSKSLGKINGNSMNNLALGVSSLATATGKLNGTSVGNLNTMAKALRSLANASGKTTNLKNTATELQTFVNAFNSMQGTDVSKVAGISELAHSIASFGNANVGRATANIPTIAKELSQLVASINQLQAVTFDTKSLNELTASIARLGYKSTAQAVQTLPQLTTELMKLFNQLSKSPAIRSEIVQLVSSLSQLANTAPRVSNGLNQANRSAKKASSGFKGLASTIGKFWASYYLVVRGIQKLGHSVESAMSYVEVVNYFDRAFEQVASNATQTFEEAGYDSAEAYAKSFEDKAKELTTKMTGYNITDNGLSMSGAKNLGLNPSDLMNYQAEFAQMSSSMGVASDYAVKLSNVLTEIGADLASVKNMEFNEVWEDMASGLVGMSRTWDKFGVNIRNTNMQQKLYDLGIDASITKLNQQDKALLRTIILLDSTEYAYADLSRTLSQPANQLRLLSANFNNLSRSIGGLFLPVVQNVLPYINGMTIALQRLVMWFTELLGIEVDLSSSNPGMSNNVSDLLDEMEDNANSTTEAMEELKYSIMGFDEINKLDDNKDKGTGVGNAFADQIALQKAFDEAYENYQKVWNKAFNDLDNNSQKIADRIEKTFEPVKKIIKDFAIGDYLSAGKDTSKLIVSLNEFIADAIKGINWSKIGKNIGLYLKGLDWVAIFDSLADVISSAITGATRLWGNMFKEAPIETALISALAINKFTKFSDALSDKLSKSLGKKGIKLGGIPVTLGLGALAWTMGNSKDELAKFLSVIAGGLAGYATFGVKGALIGVTLTAGLQIILHSIDFIGDIKENVSADLANFITDTLLLGGGAGAGFFLGGPVGAVIGFGAGAILDLAIRITDVIAPDVDWDALYAKYDVNIPLSETTQNTIDAIEKLTESLKDIDTANLEKLSNMKFDKDNIDAVADAYIKLSQKGTLNDADLTLLQSYVSELENYGVDVSGYIDEGTKAWKGTADQLQDLIDKQYESLQLEAYSQMIIDNQKAMAELGIQAKDIDFQIANDKDLAKLDKAMSSLTDREKEVALQVTMQTTEGGIDKALQARVKSGQITEKAYDNISKALKGVDIATIKNYRTLRISQKGLQTSYDQTSDKVDYLYEQMQNIGTEASKKTEIDVSTTKAEKELYTFTGKNRTSTVTVNADKKTADVDLTSWQNQKRKTLVDVIADMSGARIDLNKFTSESRTTTVGTKGDTSGASSQIGKYIEGKKTTTIFTQATTTDAQTTVQKFIDAYSKLNITPKVKVDTNTTENEKGISALANKVKGFFSFNVGFTSGQSQGVKLTDLLMGGIKALANLGNIKAYATGGVIEDGLFTMNRGEIAGKFNNGKSVVANNEQITTGIANAVYPAVYNAVSQAMANNGNNNSNQPINNTIYLDSDVLMRGMTRANRNNDMRYNPVSQI